MNRLVIVTGARGAIGRHVVDQLAKRGDRVLGLGHGAQDPTIPTLDWINGTIEAANLSALTAKWGRPDAIIHLAGGSSVGPSLVAPAEDFERTTTTGVRLLEWTRTAAPNASLVFASSAAVYGSEHCGPIPEGAARLPCSPYGVHKAMLEMACESWARQFGVKVAIVRLFSVYGPQLRKQLIWEQVNKLLSGESVLRLGGTGSETRDWTHIADAARFLVASIDLADAKAPIFNGCSGVSTTIRETLSLVAEICGYSPDLRFSCQSRAGDPIDLVGDATNAHLAGLISEIPFREGIKQTYEWIKASRA